MHLRPRHVRTRLTLWYLGVLSGVLALYIGSTLAFLSLSQRRELDRRLHAEFETVEDLLVAAPDGVIRMGGHGDEESGRLVEVWSADGGLLYGSEALHGETLGGPAPSRVPMKESLDSVMLADKTPLRVLSRAHQVAGRDLVVRVALSEERQRHEWRELMLGLLFGLPLAIAIAGLGGHWLAQRVLRPLDRMAKHAERLTAENLGERLPVENRDDELGHLARVFNLSLARIEGSFAQLRRFTADASHELRTPLTAIRTVGEVALQDPQNPDRYREAIGSMLEEVDRLSRLVGSLLVLSRADAVPALRRQDLCLIDLVKNAASLLEVLADEKGQRIEVHGDPGVTAEVDALILRQALINLIDNAIKYSPPDGLIRIDVERDETSAAAIAVSDQGPGIPQADRSRVFERFYRIDEARSREDGGAGLGLSIALWAVQAHGGRIDVQSQEGAGSTFRIVLPETSGRPAG
jgi:heavy metal sensor kinase